MQKPDKGFVIYDRVESITSAKRVPVIIWMYIME